MNQLLLIQATAKVVSAFSIAQRAAISSNLSHLMRDALNVLNTVLNRVRREDVAPINKRARNGHSHPLGKGIKVRCVVEVNVDANEIASGWDPDPVDVQIEDSRNKALLLEILRRAAHDWVLYRQHNDLALKQIAADAYVWLFEEEPGHQWWSVRQSEKRTVTAFLMICEAIELDPKNVRNHVRKLDVKTIMSAGRPAERRHLNTEEESGFPDHGVSVSTDINCLDDSPLRSSYENHFAVRTLSDL
jgi:hypothetical protein